MPRGHTHVVILTLALTAPVTVAGDLNPPAGPIQPTDRVTLNQNNVTFPVLITEPGSYVLTSNLTGISGAHGIVIMSDDVTIDLNGFTLQGVPSSLDGITVDGGTLLRNIDVSNGTVTDWGGDGVSMFQPGIFPNPGTFALSNRFNDLMISDNGATGIVPGGASLVKCCIVRRNGSTGISLGNDSGRAVQCIVDDNGGDGIFVGEGGTVDSCNILNNDDGGIETFNTGAKTIINCTIERNAGGGIQRASTTNIINCSITNHTTRTLELTFGNYVSGCRITNNGQGVTGTNVAPAGRNRITDNHISNNGGFGIDMPNNPGNQIYRNTVIGNTGGAINAPGSDAPLAPNGAVAGPWDNIGP